MSKMNDKTRKAALIWIAGTFLLSVIDLYALVIPNFSFEDPDREGLNPEYTFSSPPGWTGVGGVEETRSDRYGNVPYDVPGHGKQVGYINLGSSSTATAQATSDVVGQAVAGSQYILTIAIAERASGDKNPDGDIGLLIDGVAVGTFTHYEANTFPDGAFTDVTYNYTATAEDDGEDIQIQMNFTYDTDSTGWQQAQFDNIRLEENDGTFEFNCVPSNDAANVEPNVVLQWLTHQQAISYDVYFGADPIEMQLLANVTEASHALPKLCANKTYYWQIDVRDEVGIILSSDVHHFTTRGKSVHWKFDEGQGNSTVDTINGITGIFYGSPLWTQGINDQSVYFDGVDDYIEMPALNLNTNTLTISAWIRRDGDQSDWAGIVFCRDGNTVAGLSFGTNNELRYHWNADSSSYDWNSGLIVPDNQWVFVALAVEPDKATMYLIEDGQGYSAANRVPHSIEEFDGVVHIGQDPGLSSRRFKGKIDDLKIYKHALDSTCVYRIPGDINEDNMVNISDLKAFAQRWLERDGHFYDFCIADINDDYEVDLIDFSMMSCNFSKTVSFKDLGLLTPPPPHEPQINGPDRYGVYPSTPLIYYIPVTGDRPMQYSAVNLPAGLSLDSNTGIITGSIGVEGEYGVTLQAQNALGSDDKLLTIVVGDALALTPPMAWNSWNGFQGSISENSVKQIADALVNSGLRDYGFQFVNLDDQWAMSTRDSITSRFVPDSTRFPNGMEPVRDYLHERGFKFGIYSTAAHTTCAGTQPGSYGYEAVDAETFAEWGIDFVKYDYCHAPGDQATAIARYTAFSDELKNYGRSVVYSICEWGQREPWLWGKSAGGHLWRTTYDTRDHWEFNTGPIGVLDSLDLQVGLESHNGPGGWNDPDMMMVGIDLAGSSAGYGATGLNYTEERSMMSLWSLLSAPLIFNADLRKLDPTSVHYDEEWAVYYKDIVCNAEVIAINQDYLGLQAVRVHDTGDLEVWAKDLSDGSKAVGLLNRGDSEATIQVNWSQLGISGNQVVRDVWRQEDMGVFGSQYEASVRSHEVVLIKMTPVN
ncbi:MAG: putative Ig domain-containing protein [Anaerohalosphaera sp.]|nr:putative Ig domain-containing protein [Anaerohalosphaera sp.]